MKHFYLLKCFILAATLLCVGLSSCASLPKSSANKINQVNFLIQTDNEAPHTYGEKDIGWQLTTSIATKKDSPKTYYYDLEIQSPQSLIRIKRVKYKYGEYGKWRVLDKQRFISSSEQPFSNKQILRNIPVTIRKGGKAHKQVFHIDVQQDKRDPVTLVLLFGMDKCIARNENEAICF